MIIRTQDNDGIYDFDKLLGVYSHFDDKKDCFVVYALAYAGDLAFPLGAYKTSERAEEVIAEIFALCTSASLYEMPFV